MRRSSIPAKPEASARTGSRDVLADGGPAAAWPRGWTRKRTGIACSRWASSSVSGWRARCCTRRTICSSTRRPPRSTSPRKPRCTACLTEKLPDTTIVSIGHRSTLDAFHQRNISAGARRRSIHAAGRQAGVGSVAGWLTASAAAMAGGAPRGARDRRTRSKAARRPAPAPAGMSMADCLIPSAAG